MRSGQFIIQPGGYKAFVPNPLPPDPPISIDLEMLKLLSEANRAIGRLEGSTENLPNPDLFVAMYVKKEAVLSSQIEGTQASLTDVLEFESKDLSHAIPEDIGEVVSYVEAINYGLKRLNTFPLSLRLIKEIHAVLMINSRGQNRTPGEFRRSQNWIGAAGSTLKTADFIPPPVPEALDAMSQLEKYIHEGEEPLLIKCGLVHAQFETIHPFVDGNGRTGRTLIHKSLKDDGVLHTIALPISAGLLNNLDSYLNSLKAYQEGNPLPIIEQVFKAIELSLAIGENVSAKISSIIQNWENIINERKTSTIWKLIYLLIEQPVINTNLIKEKLHLTLRGANKLIDRAIGYGILTKFGNQKKGMFYQSSEIIAVLDDITQIKKLYRI